jgi:hypothetical protein
MPFQRFLDGPFISLLNRLYDQPASWWRKLVDAKDVFLAIRNNYINAYSHGMSIGKVHWDGTAVRLLVHEEYLTLTNADRYINLLAGVPTRARRVIFTDHGYASHLPLIKRRAGRFAGAERKGTNQVACRVPTVLDMEAAFQEESEREPEPEYQNEVSEKRGRMDLVVLGSDLRLVVFEAKLHASGDLRAKGIPKVCGQLQEYHHFLCRNQRRLETAYRTIFCYFAGLRGTFFEERIRHQRWVQVLNKPPLLGIDPVPRLLIFGFDQLQQKGVAEEAARIAQGVSIRGFTPGHIRAVGGASSIKENHLTPMNRVQGDAGIPRRAP